MYPLDISTLKVDPEEIAELRWVDPKEVENQDLKKVDLVKNVMILKFLVGQTLLML